MTAEQPPDGGTDHPGWADWTTPGATGDQPVEQVAEQVLDRVAEVAAGVVDHLLPGTPAADALDDAGAPDAEDLDEYLTQKFAEEGALLTATQAQWDTFNEWS